MRTYTFKAKDTRGDTTEGIVKAESTEQAIRMVRDRGLLPVVIRVASNERGLSAAAQTPTSGKPLEGRACPKGTIQCSLREGSVEVEGSFNLWGEQGKVYVIFELDGTDAPYLKIGIEDVARVQVSGLFSKRLVLRLKMGRAYVFTGDVAEMNKYCEVGKYEYASGLKA